MAPDLGSLSWNPPAIRVTCLAARSGKDMAEDRGPSSANDAWQPQEKKAHPTCVPDGSNSAPEAEVLPVTSSMPADVPEEQATLFREVLTVLEEERVPYAVSGAFALRAHTGICRFTKDLDLFMTARTACRAFPYLLECGLECDICDRVWLAKARRGEFFVDLITGMTNAVIVVEDSWIERAIPAVVYGVTTRVLAAE